MTWNSSNDSIATVVDGVVTAVAAGTTTITVTTADGKFTATCEVTIEEPESTDSETPDIKNQPQDRAVVEGSTATFKIIAQSIGTLSYQWQKFVDGDWENIERATEEIYETEKTIRADDGTKYRCVVTNTDGDKTPRTATSNPATLSVSKKGDSSSGGGGVSTTVSYKITVTVSEGGKASPNTTSVVKGLDKTFTFTADEGFEIADVLVDGKSVGAVKTYTFKNVSSEATLKVLFKESGIEGPISDGWDNPFVDVTEKDWFYEAVKAICEDKLMNGVSDNRFDPKGTTSRAMAVIVLYRFAGEPVVEQAALYDDVDDNMWYTNAIAWGIGTGVVNGIGNNLYAPNANVTREQFAAILYRYAKVMELDVSQKADLTTFTDAKDVSAYAVGAMQWAVGSGLMSGKGNGILDPGTNVTRAEMAKMIQNLSK